MSSETPISKLSTDAPVFVPSTTFLLPKAELTIPKPTSEVEVVGYQGPFTFYSNEQIMAVFERMK